MAREDRDFIGFFVALVSEFADRYCISQRQAYAYLKRFEGIKHLYDNYGVLHTFSFPETVDIMAQVCANHGGELK